MRPSRKIGLLVALILLPIGLVWFGINLYLGMDDAYAQWGAADMVIDYMETHDGQWPPNWKAIEPAFNAGGGRVGGWSFAEYKSRVYIDFHADPASLRSLALRSDSVPFDVIHARWTWGVKFGRGPNAALYEYFRLKAGIVEAHPPRGGWPSLQAKEIANRWCRRGASVQFDDAGNVVQFWTDRTLPRSLCDADLAELKEIPHLTSLNLVGCCITDAGIAHLKDVPTIERLELSDGITDTGLEHLKGTSWPCEPGPVWNSSYRSRSPVSSRNAKAPITPYR